MSISPTAAIKKKIIYICPPLSQSHIEKPTKPAFLGIVSDEIEEERSRNSSQPENIPAVQEKKRRGRPRKSTDIIEPPVVTTIA